MYWSDQIELGSIVGAKNSEGYPINVFSSEKTVYGDDRSAVRSEFYAASAAGTTITGVFAVHMEDYSEETAVRVSGHVYTVVRGFRKGLGDIELTCKDAEANQ